MQNKNIAVTEKPRHTITLSDRNDMALTGVSDVVNFSDSAVELTTASGGLVIKGKTLSISKLDTVTGELKVSGDICSVAYSNTKKKTPLFEGLFK